MNHLRRTINTAILVAAATLSLGAISSQAVAATADNLNQDATQALQLLYKNNPVAENISKHATAILVFPKIIKAGLVFGGSYGEGVLFKGTQVAGYYNSVSGSWGFQAGAQSYSYVVFLMNDKALQYLNKSDGWSIGTDPNVVVVNAGFAKDLSTTTLKKNAYAFSFDQQGLMASLSIKGTKISEIKR